MKRRCSLKTRAWLGNSGHRGNPWDTIPFQQKRVMSRIPPHRIPRISQRGSATVTVLLLFVVFSALGLAMVHTSGVHMKINGFRRLSVLVDCASENGLKRGLRDLAGWLERDGLLAPVSDERVQGLRDDPATAFPPLIEDALGSAFPRTVEESFDGMTWESRAFCGLSGLEDRGDYFRVSAALRIESSGGLRRWRARRLSVLEGSIGLLAGRLPLAAIPLYIKGSLTPAERAAFLEANGISFPPKPGEIVRPGLAVSPGGVIPDDPGPLVAKALKIGVFRPGDLSPAALRQALGLEPSAEPVPEGVYLIENDLGLGGVYVEGDLDEMVLAVHGDAQVVVFRAAGSEWRLEFSPRRCRTEFRGPEETRSFDLVPLAIVLVNGAIASLGGGVVAPDGRVELSLDGDTPAVLDGVGLTIVSADKVTISSHLVLDGVRWQDGIPYAKGTEAQLVIHAAGQDLVSGAAVEGGIAMAADGPAELKLQASLTAASGGFRIEGDERTVELFGALHADSFDGNGNALAVHRDDRVVRGVFPENSALTASAHIALFSLRVLAWLEY
jgi:hypothetical protein